MKKLVIIRHGQSQWNLENRFTGWADVSLTERGIAEAKKAGVSLKEAGFRFDVAYTSYLKRAIKTLWLLLEEMDQRSEERRVGKECRSRWVPDEQKQNHSDIRVDIGTGVAKRSQ